MKKINKPQHWEESDAAMFSTSDISANSFQRFDLYLESSSRVLLNI